MDYLTQYYSSCDEQGRLSTRWGHVEYHTTMAYITRYLHPGMRVMEIGAGTGRYSHALAQMGYQVDAGAVEEKQRSQGAGRQMLDALRKIARERSAERIGLSVTAKNSHARKVYEEYGLAERTANMEMMA